MTNGILAPLADGPAAGQEHVFTDFRPHMIDGTEYRLHTYAAAVVKDNAYMRTFVDVAFSGEPAARLPPIDIARFATTDWGYYNKEEDDAIMYRKPFCPEHP